MTVSHTTITLSAGFLLVASVIACSDDTSGTGGSGAGSSTSSASGGAGQGGASTTSSAGGAGQGGAGGVATGGGGAGAGGPISSWPVGTKCGNQTYLCSDGLDNDDDGKIDWEDPECLHPCDNSEGSLAMDVPGANQAPCKMDCFFDSDGGSGNDNCYWNHQCDPLAGPPNYYPQPENQCEYDPDANTPGTSLSCAELFADQADSCDAYCEPLTPNGCDCFGCCVIPGAPTPVFLDSNGIDPDTNPTKCTFDKLDDPTVCHPCTQVESCFNDCKPCEVCVGKPLPGPECNPPGSGGGGQGGSGTGGSDPGEQCPPGVQACGLAGQAPCPTNNFCLTGCCYAVPS